MLFFPCVLLMAALSCTEGKPLFDSYLEFLYFTEFYDCGQVAEGEFSRDPLECNKFYSCRNGRRFEHFCDPGHAFNELTKKCVDATTIPECTPLFPNFKPPAASMAASRYFHP
uniref:Chitin-binding type-2 domain-containing protein n=1 Tax=Plectus sambesii TaxID=2011161 RepID=A0A914VMI4_9BILA